MWLIYATLAVLAMFFCSRVIIDSMMKKEQKVTGPLEDLQVVGYCFMIVATTTLNGTLFFVLNDIVTKGGLFCH